MAKVSFEKKYREEKCYWGSKPSKGMDDILKYKKYGTVLDVGVGEGRNALFLAKKGFDVLGVDISEAGINKFLRLGKKLKVKVSGVVSDITKFKFDKKFDIIISVATLHFLSRKNIEIVIKKMKKHTDKSGLNLITVFTVDSPSFKMHPNKMYYFQRNELKNFYNDWKILNYKEFLTKPERHGRKGKIHTHGVAFLIAKKSFKKSS
jgi:SAM-dependent methyltransferase